MVTQLAENGGFIQGLHSRHSWTDFSSDGPVPKLLLSQYDSHFGYINSVQQIFSIPIPTLVIIVPRVLIQNPAFSMISRAIFWRPSKGRSWFVQPKPASGRIPVMPIRCSGLRSTCWETLGGGQLDRSVHLQIHTTCQQSMVNDREHNG